MTVKKAFLAIAWCLGLLLLVTLGTWQVNRGLNKESVLSKVEPVAREYPTLIAFPIDLTSLDYKKATLQGNWDEQRIILLDNRVYQSQLGYEVITPFRLSNGKIALINRGWIGHQQKSDIPKLLPSPPSGTLYIPKKGYTIGDAIQPAALSNNNWPKTSLYMDISSFSKALGETASPLIMVLDEADKNSLRKIWKPVVILPERHYAYALQWYGLAIVFIIFGVIWYRRSTRKQHTN